MDLSLRTLRYFVAAADRGNVTAAARDLHVSQPSVSLAIAQLEGIINVPLFVRQHARGVALTPAGREALREARKLLAHANDFLGHLAGAGQALRGTVALGCLTYLVPSYLGAIIKGFTGRYPDIDIVFHEGGQSELQRLLLGGEIEIALTYDLLLPPRLTAVPLRSLPPYLLVTARHRLAGRKAVSLKDICAEPCVLLDLPISRDYFASLFGSLGLAPNVRYRTTSVEAVRSFVANGLGYSILNHTSKTLTTYDGGRTRMLRLTDALRPARICAVHLTGQKLRPVAETLLAFVRDSFRHDRRASG